jgi:uncharacterized membrane protein YesL
MKAIETFLTENSWLSLSGFFISVLGMMCLIYTYYSIETGKYTRDSLGYYVVNLTGAILMLVSLLIHFNLGSFIIELFWITISLQGICRVLKHR